MIRLTAYISGRVKRTGYRAKVVSLAKEMGLVGFVQNRPEGQVLVIAEGENKDDLERLASAIKIKNALIDVQSISAEYSHGSGEYSIFRKITGAEDVGERLDDGIEILKELVVGVNKLVVGVNNLDIGIKNLDVGINNLDGEIGRAHV
jgi:acylphosphatase